MCTLDLLSMFANRREVMLQACFSRSFISLLESARWLLVPQVVVETLQMQYSSLPDRFVEVGYLEGSCAPMLYFPCAGTEASHIRKNPK